MPLIGSAAISREDMLAGSCNPEALLAATDDARTLAPTMPPFRNDVTSVGLGGRFVCKPAPSTGTAGRATSPEIALLLAITGAAPFKDFFAWGFSPAFPDRLTAAAFPTMFPSGTNPVGAGEVVDTACAAASVEANPPTPREPEPG